MTTESVLGAAHHRPFKAEAEALSECEPGTCGRDVSITTLLPVDISECELCALFGEDLLALIRSRVPGSAHDLIATSVIL